MNSRAVSQARKTLVSFCGHFYVNHLDSNEWRLSVLKEYPFAQSSSLAYHLAKEHWSRRHFLYIRIYTEKTKLLMSLLMRYWWRQSLDAHTSDSQYTVMACRIQALSEDINHGGGVPPTHTHMNTHGCSVRGRELSYPLLDNHMNVRLPFRSSDFSFFSLVEVVQLNTVASWFCLK